MIVTSICRHCHAVILAFRHALFFFTARCHVATLLPPAAHVFSMLRLRHCYEALSHYAITPPFYFDCRLMLIFRRATAIIFATLMLMLSLFRHADITMSLREIEQCCRFVSVLDDADY